MDYNALVKKQIQRLPVYQPGRPIELVAAELGLDPAGIIKLASNENPLGSSPKALAAAQRALRDAWMYPDNSGFALTRELSAKFGWEPSQLVLGAGSNEIFYLLCDLFVEPGVEVVMGAQAFVTYKIATILAGGTPVCVPMPDFCHDLKAMQAAITEKTRLVFLPNPNNPTGTLVPFEEVKAFVEALPDHVVFCYDEAYCEYLDDSLDLGRWMQAGKKIIATRTFSKIYGLSGLRIGYAYTDPELARLLNSLRPPFNTSNIAQVAACGALDDDEWVVRSRSVNAAGLRQLGEGFERLGLEFVPSSGNFVLVQFSQASSVNGALLKEGIIVRPVQGYDLPSHLRISVGTEPQNARLLGALARIMES